MEKLKEKLELLKLEFHIVEDEIESNDGLLVLRSTISTEEGATNFVKEFSMKTRTNWIVWRNLQNPSRVVYHKKYVCQHNKRHKNRSNKGEKSKRDTNCMAFIDFKIKKVSYATKKNDKYLKMSPPLPTLIKINYVHNHHMNTADSLRLLRVSDEIKHQFNEYFVDGMSPCEAARFHESKLLGDVGFESLANAQINPTLSQVYYIYNNWRDENLGLAIDPFKKLLEKIQLYENKGASVFTDLEEPWCVLLVTDVMKRAQKLMSSGEIIFLDSTSGVESSKSTLTVLLTATKAGAIPIAVLLHQCQTTQNYMKAFRILLEKYPYCFGGKEAPSIFMTDDSAAEKSALKSIWPLSEQLLCHFHVAQAEWRWLFSPANCIPKDKRSHLMKLFQMVMYADSEDSLSEAVDAVFKENDAHPLFVSRFRSFFKRREEWVLLFRLGKITRNHNTNNFSEATMRILKDIVLNRTKAFNIVALVEYCITIFNEYLAKKLLDDAYNRKKNMLLYKSLRKAVDSNKIEKIIHKEGDIFIVPSESSPGKNYEINVAIGVCSCRAGLTGALCKHQFLLHLKENLSLPNMPAISQSERHELATLAIGEKCPPLEFFSSFEKLGDDSQSLPTNTSENNLNTTMLNNSENRIDNNTSLNCIISEENMELVTDDDKINLQNEILRLNELIKDTPRNSVVKLIHALQKIKNKQDLVLAINSVSAAGKSLSKSRVGKKIRVQPTSISRRRFGASKRNSCLPSGRPVALNATYSSKCRKKRCLSLNIKRNQSNAKSHGTGH